MKIYSNQLASENINPFPEDGVLTTQEEWSLIYNSETKKIITEIKQGPITVYSHLTLVVGALEECEQYISNNGLLYEEYLVDNGVID